MLANLKRAARNEGNSSVKYGKHKYFRLLEINLDANRQDSRKTRNAELNSRQQINKVSYIEIWDMKISSASEMEEAFNCHFANIGHEMPRDIPPAETVIETYLIST